MHIRRLHLTLFFVLLTAMTVPAPAQQAGQNIPILPVVSEFDEEGFEDSDWYLKGDGYLQRQVEPTIAVSTRNPDHLLSFFNDYRAVDIPSDVGLGEARVATAAGLQVMDLMLAGFLPGLDSPIPAAPPVAAAEAWVGGSRSYDGGLTWAGFFMPGGPEDSSPASLASPVYGLEAATDPVAVSGPCGYVYVVFIAFTRGGESRLAVARFQDLNNSEGGDTWEYQGTTIVETGANATYGHFLDKPHIALDVWRGTGADDQCAHRVYVSYSTFMGKPKPNKFQSWLNFAVSTDYGESFSTKKINKNFGQNQGSFIAVDPRPGTPAATGGGTVYAFWRHFNKPDSIIMTKSTNYGSSWSSPKKIIGPTPMAKFDQPTVSTELGDPGLLTFRSNAFPTAAVTGDGTVFVAWQEKVNITPGGPAFGQPDPAGSPRIVMMRSTNGGGSWTDVYDTPNRRSAVDLGDRDGGGAPPPGFGALPEFRSSGPQVMPWLSFGGGRLALVYYESRGLLGGGGVGIQYADVTGLGFISGIDRVVDFRGALLDPATGRVLGSTQISRYPISATAELSDGEQVSDIAPVQPETCAGGGPPESCQPSLNFANKPQSAAGTSPFMGDYTGATPTVQFVYDLDLEAWRWATEPGDVPYRAFHTVFADNRNLVPPDWPSNVSEWQRYPDYGPPGIGGACVNPGSRNTDVLTARLDAGLIVATPTTYKQLDAQRGFPIRLQNGTGTTRFYHLEITRGAEFASFSVSDPSIDESDPPVEIFPYSSVSQMVYVDPGATGAVRVDVTEVDGDGATGSVTFNADPSNPEVETLVGDDAQNPFVLNPFVLNPFVLNPSSTNVSPTNPFVLNPFVVNPFVVNAAPSDAARAAKADGPEGNVAYEVIDTVWEVGADVGTNTAGSYLPVINIDNAEQFVGNYAFQLVVFKSSSFGSTNAACEAFNLTQDQILSNVVQDPTAQNPFVLNPFVLNPFVVNEGAQNPFVLNPFVLNSAFTVAPSDAPASSAKGLKVAGDGTLRADYRERTFLLLRAFRLKQLCGKPGAGEDCLQPGTDLVFNPQADPPSAAVASSTCLLEESYSGNAASECFKFYAPDLVPELREPENNQGLQATAGGTLLFPIGGFDVVNQGTADATAENRELRHGFYLTTDPTVVFDGNGEPTNADLLGFAVSGGPGTTIPVGGQSRFDDPVVLSFPTDLDQGAYNLILYVDDLEEVSEVDEVNNKLTTVVPITVLSPVELLENGSFEAPMVTAGRGWDLFTNDQVPGWSFEWTACGESCPVPPLLEIQTSGVIVTTPDGGQYAELDSDFGGAPGNQANLRLFRDFDTCEGATYSLKYSWAKRTSADLMKVSWGGTELATHSAGAGTNTWTIEELQLEGDGTTLRLEFEEVGTANSLGMLLDAVSLVGPECAAEVEGK